MVKLTYVTGLFIEVLSSNTKPSDTKPTVIQKISLKIKSQTTGLI